jgi:hypothetical protein
MYDIDFKDTNASLKSIQKLSVDGSKVVVMHEDAVGWAESDRAVVTTLDGNAMTIGANTPVSDVVYYSSRAGIGLNFESFAQNNNRKYFVDVDQGQVCRVSLDGITPISNKNMNRYFKEVFREMINSPQPSFAFGAYDKRTEEYIVNLKWNDSIALTAQAQMTVSGSGETITYVFDDISQYDVYVGQLVRFSASSVKNVSGVSLYGFTDAEFEVSTVASNSVTFSVPTEFRTSVNEILTNGSLFGVGWFFELYPAKSSTLAYSEKLGAWTSYYSWQPEHMTSAGVDFVSFRGGKLYIHDDTDNPCNFYGVDYPAWIDIYSNAEPDKVKFWNTFSITPTTDSGDVSEDDFEVALSVRDTLFSLNSVAGGCQDSRNKFTSCATPVYKEQQIFFPYLREGAQQTITQVQLNTNSGLSSPDSGVTLDVAYNTSNLDIYVGQFVDLQLPSFTDCSTTWSEITFKAQVIAVTDTTITFQIPITASIRSQVACLVDSAVLLPYGLRMFVYFLPYSNYISGERLRGYWNRTRLVIKPSISKIYKILTAKFNLTPSQLTR